MSAVAGPVYAASLLLASAGLLKLRRPLATVRALRSAGLPAPTAAGRILGGSEVAAAAWCVASGSRAACVLLALAYLGFSLFSLRLLLAGDDASCGCFGEADTPASPLHVAVNALLGFVAVVAAVDPPGSMRSVLADQPLAGFPLLLFAGLGAWAAYLTMSLLPDLQRAVRETAP